MTKIAIFGLGGVGGYLGARLADFYKAGSQNVEIDFLARGETLNAVKKEGIILEFKGSTIVGCPTLITDNPSKIGVCNYVIFCAKNYALDSFLSEISPTVGKDTVLLSFANGVEAYDKIKSKFPKNFVAPACVYIISQIVQKGRVMCTSANPLFMFGNPNSSDERLDKLAKIFKDAGVNTVCTPDILIKVWQKFAFISPLSTAMANFDMPYGKFRKDENANHALESLLKEFSQVAKKAVLNMPDTLYEDTLASYDKLMPSDSTTSMQRDFIESRKSELESLTAYISKLGKKFGVETPTYDKFYELLKRKEDLNQSNTN